MSKKDKYLVILVQLGSPKSTSVKDLRSYLREFLSDPRVVDLNPRWWKIILNLFILPFRPKKSAEAYKRIECFGTFPLIEITRSLSEKLNTLTSEKIEVRHCFALSTPRLKDLVKQLGEEWQNYEHVSIIPLFPQYSESTSASVFDVVGKTLKDNVYIPKHTFINRFHRLESFINLSVEKIIEAKKKENFSDLVLSFHGIPTRRVLTKKDPYFRDCYETYSLIKERILRDYPQHFTGEQIHLCFQSLFGKEVWLQPYTDEYCVALAKEGKSIGVQCPSFLIDCLETVDEIGTELKSEVEVVGGRLVAIPCLNDSPAWCAGFADFIESHVRRFEDTSDFCAVSPPEEGEYQKLRETMPSALAPEKKKTLLIVFLILFIDLMGFSLIFPLFPAILNYYQEVDPQNYLLQKLTLWAQSLATTKAGAYGPIVFFGGILGALYSLLQFVMAPLWGRWSDEKGRKPILLYSSVGILLSYVLWFFSGNFTLFFIARVLGGMMSGNLSVASAVVSDITDHKTRSKGMAVIGIAFGLGFIFGPAIGGLSSLLDLREFFSFPGINPFSFTAALASILALFNVYYIAKKFKETLNPKREKSVRTSNIISLLRPFPYRGVERGSWAHFFFLVAFSGMEFTLTFLTLEKLGYTPSQNALMFVFIGLTLALVQGGYVRRKAEAYGEKKLIIRGLFLVFTGLICLSFLNHQAWHLYLSLLFLATGAAMIIPCLSAYTSLAAPAKDQGKVLGRFRSLGALARVLGPLTAATLYWSWGSQQLYWVCAAMILLPFFLIFNEKEKEKV